jgi:beta-glucosidase
MGWGSGTTEFPYLVDPLSAISSHAAADGTSVKTSISDSDLAAAAAAATGVEVAFVFVNSDSGEGYITGTSIFAWEINLYLFEIDDLSRRQCWGPQ